MLDFSSISVTPGSVVKVINPTSYPLIGKGSQGAVFRLSPDRCIKIYSKQENAIKEANAYRSVQGSPIIPKFYEVGPNYIIIEYIDGPSLKEYLFNERSLCDCITKQILFVIRETSRLGFPRQDWSLRHIMIDRSKKLKVIDLIHAMKHNKTNPKNLFTDLNRLGMLETFMEHVRKYDIELYHKWKESMSKYYVLP